jgi:hypothetical protein
VVGRIMKTRLDRLSAFARQGRRQQSGAMVVRAADEPKILPMGTVVGSICLDVLRRPLFYMVRTPRLPRILFTHGIRRSLQLAAYGARSPRWVAGGFSLRLLFTRLARLLSKWGWRPASARRSTRNPNSS